MEVEQKVSSYKVAVVLPESEKAELSKIVDWAQETIKSAQKGQESRIELELEWMSMCNRMPQQFSGIATRMKNMSPVITDYPAVEIVAENQLALEQMQQIKGKILNTLKLHLRNNAITLTMRQAEHHEAGKILTRREQYEQMVKENPSIAKLRDLLDLQLA
jgi:DNA polymerase-3 subunit gamma/tau